MGLYDQLLGVTQQGLNNIEQTAQLRSQQPTFADVFMDRFRQAGQDQLQRQKMQSDMALNEAYKQAQMRQMEDTSNWHKRQRDLELAKYISENKTGDNGPDIEAFVVSQGGSPSMIPQMRYQEAPYQVESAPAFEGGSLAEGGEDTETTKIGKMPIEWSDWGAGAAFKQKNLDLKQRLAEMSMETKSYLAQLKANDAKSAVGKIMQDLANGRISQALANDAITKATVYFDPANSALIGQGLNPAGSGLPIRQFQQTPGATQLPQGQPQTPQQTGGNMGPQMEQPAQPAATNPALPAPAPRAQTKAPTKPAKGPVPFASGKAAIAAQQEQESYKAFDSKLAETEKFIDENIIGHPGYESALSPAGTLLGKIPKTKEYTVHQNIGVLKNKIMLEAMEALKQASPNGATGFGQLSEREGDTLRNSIASLNENMSKQDFDKTLVTIKSEIRRLRNLATEKANSMSAARNVAAPEPTPQKNYEGEVSPTGAYVFKSGAWVKRGK